MAVDFRHPLPVHPHWLAPAGRVLTVVGMALVAIVVLAVLAYILWVLGIIVVKAVTSLPLGHAV